MRTSFQLDSLSRRSDQVVLVPMEHLSHDIVSGGRVLERDPFQVREVGLQDRGEAVEFVQVAILFRCS
jgi:hypothetical protein